MESEQGGNSPLHGGKGYPALLVASAPHFTATVFYGGEDPGIRNLLARCQMP